MGGDREGQSSNYGVERTNGVGLTFMIRVRKEGGM